MSGDSRCDSMLRTASGDLPLKGLAGVDLSFLSLISNTFARDGLVLARFSGISNEGVSCFSNGLAGADFIFLLPL